MASPFSPSLNASITPEIKRFRLQPRQREFCRSEADICIYGGAAGGGKSYALLYEPIGRQLHDVKRFTGVIFRRDSKQITNPGGLWDQAGEIYPYALGRPIVGLLEYRWKNGVRIGFRHLENEEDKHKYQGAEFCYIGFDELTHFTQSQFWYLLSRNRSTCGVKPYVRATCNPDPGWVKTLLAPWVEDGFEGTRASSGELRWFVRVDGKIQWVEEGTKDAKSLTFIRASIYDNPALLRINPEYVATLKALPPVERARLLDGDWNVRREGLVYSGFDSCIVDMANANGVSATVGGCDFGFNNPFASLWGYVDHDDVLHVTGCRYVRQTTLPVHAEAIPRNVRYSCDPSGAESIAQLRAYGHDVYACIHRPVRAASGEKKSPLLAGIDMVSDRIRTGRLKIHREACLPLIRELSNYHYDETKQVEEPVKEDDHACDALRYMVVMIDRGTYMQADWDEQEVLNEEQREKQIEQQAKVDSDLRAQNDPFDERWFS